MHRWRGNERNPRYAGAKANWRGMFWLGKRREYAHRAAWRLWVGDIPDGLVMRHSARCTSTLCVLVAHLLPGTPAENAADRETKRRFGAIDALDTKTWTQEIRDDCAYAKVPF